MDLDVGPWTAAVGYQVLESSKEQQEEAKVNVERGKNTTKRSLYFEILFMDTIMVPQTRPIL